MQNQQLDAIAEAANKASKGKWTARDFTKIDGKDPIHTMKLSVQRSALGSFNAVDALFIEAAQPSVVLELVEEIKRLKAALGE